MDKNLLYVSQEDISCALELIYGKQPEYFTSALFGLNAAMDFLNLGSILDTDKVFTMGLYLELAEFMISYLYTPESLTVYNLAADRTADWYTEPLSGLLTGYHYTPPVNGNAAAYFPSAIREMMELSDHFTITNPMEESYDVAVIGAASLQYSKSQCYNRFTYETGWEYELFQTTVMIGAKVLRNYGRIIILAKPCWILTLWKTLNELDLQLDYPGYWIYTDNRRHPNVFLWLRFEKQKDGINMDKQKKNILTLMSDNRIDRLYAHRNNLYFPFAKLSYNNTEAYVDLDQNLEYMQYFFSLNTTKNLAVLCEEYTACLVTPSVARFADTLKKDVVLFERDNRFRENRGPKFVKYDLNSGLTRLNKNKYAHKFNRVICDPPFDIKLEVLAGDIAELLLKHRNSMVYIIYPAARKNLLIQAMKCKGLQFASEQETICIEYARPPKLVRINGKDAIQLFKFVWSE